MERVKYILVTLRRWAQKLGPYLLLEILLPGGTLFALLLLLYRTRIVRLGPVAQRPPLLMTRTLIRNAQQGA
jgi:hypothetical protein